MNINFFKNLLTKLTMRLWPSSTVFYAKNPFKKGMIFVWSDKNIELSKIDYSDLEKVFGQKCRQKFDVTIICILSGRVAGLLSMKVSTIWQTKNLATFVRL